MIPKGIIDRFFDAASIQRWNDHVRPVELTELDKQAHKAIIVWVLAKVESDRGQPIDWLALIEGCIFEFLPRVVLTDIKAPVFHRLMAEKGPEIRAHVLRTLKDDLDPLPGDLAAKFAAHLEQPADATLERRILDAAHYLASKWEFKIIAPFNRSLYGIEQTSAEIESALENHLDLPSVTPALWEKEMAGFIDLCGQLRFQQRWAQTPRVPRTAVLGHSLFVAMLSYLFTLELGARSERRKYNNFFSALFHDLPEVLTRDIVSPVKRSVEGLDQVIGEIEKQMVEEKLLPLLPAGWHDEMRYFLKDQFATRIREDGRQRLISAAEINDYDEDRFDPVDGEMIKACDDLAAYIEAAKSLEFGIRSRQLEHGKESIYAAYRECQIGGLTWKTYFDYFY